MKNQVHILLSALSLGVPLWAAAQTPPSAPAAELNYQSAFVDYKPYQDIKPGDWRAANDMVGRVSGGDSGHGMSMTSQPKPAAPSTTQPGHRMGGTQK